MLYKSKFKRFRLKYSIKRFIIFFDIFLENMMLIRVRFLT